MSDLKAIAALLRDIAKGVYYTNAFRSAQINDIADTLENLQPAHAPPVAHSKSQQKRLAAMGATTPPVPSEELNAYEDAMMAAGVPHEPLAIYDSNSWRRVGTSLTYREVMIPTTQRDGQPDICGLDTLRALVAAFNLVLKMRHDPTPKASEP